MFYVFVAFDSARSTTMQCGLSLVLLSANGRLHMNLCQVIRLVVERE
ncbi:hypothetical protein [Enterovibrio norvegicus]|nr:hypothetical protein [Enterovibrio norvegicus]